MGEVARHGRTVVFVSHNMAAVTHFCPRSIWLEGGRLKEDGPSAEVIARYMAEGGGGAGAVEFPSETAPRSDSVRLCAVRTKNQFGETVDTISTNEPLTIEVEYETFRKTSGLRVGLTLLGREGEVVLSTKDLDVFPSDF
jgi:lipopolysaccharide transport system ATP-binding protein